MKVLAVGECRDGKLLESTYELFGFASRLGAEAACLLAASEDGVSGFDGTLYLFDAGRRGEYDPDLHKQLILQAVIEENPDYVVFLHSSYGWDLAPRVAVALRAAQITEITGVTGEGFEAACCNGKMLRIIRPATGKAVLTIQSGAFPPLRREGKPLIKRLQAEGSGRMEFIGYEPPEAGDVDLSKAEVIVAAGRGIGRKEHVAAVAALAEALGGELGASRPVVDAAWVEHSRQVGITGQSVSAKLYVACGISGSIQHIAGIRNCGFIVAINKDKEAPIAEKADVMVVADVVEFVPALTEKLKALRNGG